MSDQKETREVSDELFARVAVSRRFATLRALGECLETMRREGGGRQSLSATMLRQGVLTREDVETVLTVARAGELDLRHVEEFAIVTKIGEGGMGAVYAAMDCASYELCAIKVLPRDLAKDEGLVKRFKREAEVAVGLQHENLVCGIRTGEVGGMPFFAMEFVDGETVYERLEREGEIPEGDTLRILRGTCLALQYASEHGLVHRDIKPENIMLARDGTAKLCDLGLVKKDDASRVSRLTHSGMAIGTPHYISPEQARGEHDVDTRSDIYALGATAYHMLTGAVPFEGSTAAVIMTKHLTEELAWPADVNPDISEHTSRLISKMMAKEPHNRYQRPKDVVADVDLILSGRAPSGDLLPPGASSIRGAFKMSRAIEKAARKQRERSKSGTTAVHERIKKRRAHSLLRVLDRHRKVAMPVAGALIVLAVAVLVTASMLVTAGRDEPARRLPKIERPSPQPSAPSAASPEAPRVEKKLLAERLEELMDAEVERIPELIDALADLEDLTPEEARIVFATKRSARQRFDAEAERRLKDVLWREEQGRTSPEEALEELTKLQGIFARSGVLARITAAVADHTGPGRARVPKMRGVPLIRAEGFFGPDGGWKAYGDWRLEGGEIVFRYDAQERYSHALQSPFGFGELRLTGEIYTEGGRRGEVVMWEQATEDAEGKSEEDGESAVRIALGETELGRARGRWAGLEIAVGPDGVRAQLDGTPLPVERTGTLSHGRLTFSFVGGLWRIRHLQVVPELGEGEVVYEASFEEGELHGWSGRPVVQSTTGRRRRLAAVPCPGEWGVWASVGAGGEAGDVRNWPTLFEVADGMRLAFTFRAERVPELRVRLVLKNADAGSTVYRLRLSGRPLEDQWTALTVPLADFRAVRTTSLTRPGRAVQLTTGRPEEGDSPPAGGAVTGLWIGAPAAQPELELSLVRVVR